METPLVNRYAVNMLGVLSCYDRILIMGTLPGACYAGGMSSLLYSRGIRIFDYAQFAEPLRERIRTRAQEVGDAAGLEIEHVSKSHIRKEELAQRVLASHGCMTWIPSHPRNKPLRRLPSERGRAAMQKSAGV